jgi:pilus assembly protein Flp/PilA
MKDLFKQFVADESGQGMVEYIIIIAIIAVSAIAALGLFRDDILAFFQDTSAEMHTSGPDTTAGSYTSQAGS